MENEGVMTDAKGCKTVWELMSKGNRYNYRPIVNFLYRYLSIVHLPDSLCIWGILYGIVFLSVLFLNGKGICWVRQDTGRIYCMWGNKATKDRKNAKMGFMNPGVA